MGKTKADPSAPTSLLLLDGSRNGLLARSKVLEQEGYAVLGCRTLDGALERLLDEAVDLAIVASDVNQAKWIPALREAGFAGPLILISGLAESYGLSSENTGADAVVQKSALEIAELQREVRRLLHPKPRRKPASTVGAKTPRPISKRA